MRYAALGLLGLLGLAGVVLLVWRVPSALYGYVPDPKDRAAAEASTRTGLIAGLAGLAALGSLAITGRTYRLTEQGHITDRYTKAIEQLGSAKLDVRLGGVYALERIAVDSRRDHPTVVEVLSAFVREHSDPAHTDAESTIAEVLNRLLRSDSEPVAGSQPNGGAKQQPRPTTDVQATLNVLGRLPRRSGISRGDLAYAQLGGAGLNGADLTGASFAWAHLSGAQLIQADLSYADLRGVDLSRADLSGADLSHADLSGADLSGAQLNGTKLYGAQLGGANLSGASLVRANLADAWLADANLTRAVLERANLVDAHLDGASLSQAQIDVAYGNRMTRLPDGLRHPANWIADDVFAEALRLFSMRR